MRVTPSSTAGLSRVTRTAEHVDIVERPAHPAQEYLGRRDDGVMDETRHRDVSGGVPIDHRSYPGNAAALRPLAAPGRTSWSGVRRPFGRPCRPPSPGRKYGFPDGGST